MVGLQDAEVEDDGAQSAEMKGIWNEAGKLLFGFNSLLFTASCLVAPSHPLSLSAF